MDVPVISLPVVYHIGTLNPADRGKQWATSHEGAGLSVSLCPEAWQGIARLGGSPLQRLTKPDALFIDLHALDEPAKASIRAWAEAQGLLETKERWRFWQQDDSGRWSDYLAADETAALTEVIGFDASDLSAEELRDELADAIEMTGLPPGCDSLVQRDAVPVLTRKGSRRAKGFGSDRDGTQMAVMFWAEDVLRKRMPEVVGVWWSDDFEPASLLAPSGAILPSCVKQFNAQAVDWRMVDKDDELLLGMPPTRLVDPSASASPYRFVTSCVSSTAELIGAMTDSPADTELDFRDFAKALGNGSVREGRQILDEAFPYYKGSGLDIGKDWAVRFHASAFDGMPCLYVVHSAIEYVFQRDGFLQAPVYEQAAADVFGSDMKSLSDQSFN